jgi:hypothetical protein
MFLLDGTSVLDSYCSFNAGSPGSPLIAGGKPTSSTSSHLQAPVLILNQNRLLVLNHHSEYTSCIGCETFQVAITWVSLEIGPPKKEVAFKTSHMVSDDFGALF